MPRPFGVISLQADDSVAWQVDDMRGRMTAK